MDNKFYVSLEAARLLKEKGYNEPTEYLHSDDIIYKGICLNYLKPELCGGMIVEDNVSYPCPTKAEAIDWLEGKNLTINIDWIRFNEQRRWCYGICNNETCDLEGSRYEYITRLEAEDAAIIKACELL